MAITPSEARAFTGNESEFLYQFERSVDLFVRTSGLVSGETTVAYKITGQERTLLTDKVMNEAIRRYNNAGWDASFAMAGPNPQDFVLVDTNG
jgi:hypothetical protein